LMVKKSSSDVVLFSKCATCNDELE
jgi:hypothetical protein